MKLAPIVLFVYNRPWHTRQTVESLKSNKSAGESELFIFSDGPKDSSDEAKVAEVRTYIRSIDDFKKISIKESRTNIGLAESVISGVSDVLKEFDKVIVLEDDLILSGGFLNYINGGLEFYQDNPKIFSLTGYCPPIEIPPGYGKDVFFTYRSGSWGWATYRDNWNKVDWDIISFDEFSSNVKEQHEFNIWGEDLTPMLKAQYYGLIDSWAVRWSYAHFQNQAFCVYPVGSLVQNIGADNSGTHFKKTKKYKIELKKTPDIISFSNEIVPDYKILNEINKLVKPSYFRKVINTVKFNYLAHQLSGKNR